MSSEVAVDTEEKSYSLFRYRFESAGRGPVIWGFTLLLPMLVSFGIWSGFAPINAAAIANAEVVLNDDRKTIQHLEGGIVEEILVTEAQEVDKGQAVLIIRDVSQRAQIDTLYDQLANARALNVRLKAERDSDKTPDFSMLTEGIEIDEDSARRLMKMQLGLFHSRNSSLETKIKLIKARKEQAKKELEGIKVQLTWTKKQLSLLQHELKGVSKLYAKKVGTLTNMLALKKEGAALEVHIGELVANIAKSKQIILSSDMEIIDIKLERQNSILEQLQANELAILELNHQLRMISDTLERTVVRAPVRGRVMDLQVHTQGAVISPGQRILDIVPVDDRLILEAKVNPSDIDLVAAGINVKVLLSAYKSKKVPKLDGLVLNVSGDILTDEMSGERYFLARVQVDDSIFGLLNDDVDLYPGMPVQVFFLAGERTLIDYLLSPVIDATYRAFREE
ncbi:MAG: HlyD family type I secretion periplasmic adaptor subunit [Sedimenticola sp.]